MARISVDQAALTDSRYEILAQIAGLADADHARGRMIRVWNECQERETYTLRAETLDSIFHVEASGELLIRSALARRVRPGLFYVCGSRGRIEWLKKRREEGRKGGFKGGRPKKPIGVSDGKTPGGIRGETPPAPAPAPAPAQTQNPPTPRKRGDPDQDRGPGNGAGPGPQTRALRRERERLAVDAVTDPGWKPDEIQRQALERRRELQSLVAEEHRDWRGPEISAEASRRWKAEGWEERVCPAPASDPGPEINPGDFPELPAEAS